MLCFLCAQNLFRLQKCIKLGNITLQSQALRLKKQCTSLICTNRFKIEQNVLTEAKSTYKLLMLLVANPICSVPYLFDSSSAFQINS